jgi:hypothetical protein
LSAAALLALSLVISAPAAEAASYVGRGDTGGYHFIFTSECCATARTLAHRDGERACRRTGGFTHVAATPTGGRCEWDARQTSSGVTLFRCSATASVRCRR